MTNANPWLIGPEQPAQSKIPIVPPSPRREKRLGASAPQPGVPGPDTADRLPQRTTAGPAAVWWLGVHGGAGETTRALLAAGTRPANHAWPIPGTRGTTHRVVLVARTNYAGLTAAQHAAMEWASSTLDDGVQLVGLVLMPDAPGRLPKPLRELEQIISGGVPRVWRMPWVDVWRLGSPGSGAPLPKEFRELFMELSLIPSTPAHH